MKYSVKSRLQLLTKLAYIRKEADNDDTSPLISAISYVNQVIAMPYYNSTLPANVVALIPTYQVSLKTLFNRALQAKSNEISAILDDTVKMFEFLAKLNTDPNSPLSKYIRSYIDYVNDNKDVIIKQYAATNESANQPAAGGTKSEFNPPPGWKRTSQYPFVPPELQKALKVTIDSALGPNTRAAMDKKKKQLNNPIMTDLELYKKVINNDYDPKKTNSAK